MKTVLRFLAAVVAVSSLFFAGCSNSGESSSEAEGHITRAETYARQGQYRSAMLEVRNAVQKDPGNIEHVLVLADIYDTIGADEQAEELLTPWYEEQPEGVALALARAYLARGKHLSARETLEGFSPSSDSEVLEKQVLLAQTRHRSGNAAEAAKEFRAIIEEHPDHKEAHLGLARALLEDNEPEAALDMLGTWTESKGTDPEILFLTGLAHYRLGNEEQTIDVLTEASSAVPESDVFLPVRRNILNLLARSLTEQGRVSEAQVYNKILAENTDSETRETAESAIEAIKRGDLDSARTMLEELVRENPDNDQVALMLGALNLQEGRTDEALAMLNENVDAETTPTAFLRAATIAQVDSGKREEALQTLSRAIEARSNDPELLAMHGLLALSLPEHHKAGVASLSKALELDRSRSRLRLALARHYVSQGQQEQALAQMRVGFTETPTDWTVTQNYLALLLGTGRETEAEEVKESLINGFADEPRAVTLAAITEYRLGDTAEARERLEKQTSDDPENLQALMALASVYQGEEQNDQAIDTLLRAARLAPENVAPLQNAGRVYAREHSPGEVVSWLEKTATEMPELAPNSYALAAQVQTQQGNLSEARQLLDRISEEDRNNIVTAVTGQLLVAEANQAAENENWTDARAKAAEALALQPDNLRYALVPVSLLAMEGKHEQALASLEELEDTHGQTSAIDLMRARLLAASDGQEAAWTSLYTRWEESGDTELLPILVSLAKQASPDSLDELTRSWVEASPQSANAQLTRAEYLMNSGDERGAIASYETALGQQPDNPIALNNLAWLLREREQERAIDLAAQAQELAPRNPAVLDTYGWLLHLAGRHEEAKSVIEEALVLAPDSEEIQEHLDEVNEAL